MFRYIRLELVLRSNTPWHVSEIRCELMEPVGRRPILHPTANRTVGRAPIHAPAGADADEGVEFAMADHAPNKTKVRVTSSDSLPVMYVVH